MPFAASSYKGKISCLTGHDMQCNSSVIGRMSWMSLSYMFRLMM